MSRNAAESKYMKNGSSGASIDIANGITNIHNAGDTNNADNTNNTNNIRDDARRAAPNTRPILSAKACKIITATQAVLILGIATAVLTVGLDNAAHRAAALNFCTFLSTVIITLISIVILWSELMHGFWTLMALLVMPSITFVLGCVGACFILVRMGVHGLPMVGQVALILAPFLGFLNNAIPTTHQAMKDKELADLRGVHQENKRREAQIQELAAQLPDSDLAARPKAQTFVEPFRWREIIKSVALFLAAVAYILGFLWH